MSEPTHEQSTRRLRDVRRPWRRLLALIAPIPWLALALANALTPGALGSSTDETFAAIAADPGSAKVSLWAAAVFMTLVVPSTIAMVAAYRRVSPIMAFVVGGFTTFAAGTGLTYPNVNLMALLTADHQLDTETAITLADKMTTYPTTIIAILPFFLTITIGRIALGVMVWRAHLTPGWMAIAMLAATPVEFLLTGGPFGTNFGPTACYILTSLGFSSASLILWRMTEDEFDLPPSPGLSFSASQIDRLPRAKAGAA